MGAFTFFRQKRRRDTRYRLIATTTVGGRRVPIEYRCRARVQVVGEGVVECTLSIGAIPGSRAVPGPDIRDLKKV